LHVGKGVFAGTQVLALFVVWHVKVAVALTRA